MRSPPKCDAPLYFRATQRVNADTWSLSCDRQGCSPLAGIQGTTDSIRTFMCKWDVFDRSYVSAFISPVSQFHFLFRRRIRIE